MGLLKVKRACVVSASEAHSAGLADAGMAMMDNQIIIGEGRERKRERDGAGLSGTTWTAVKVKGPQCWGHRGGAVVDCRYHHEKK